MSQVMDPAASGRSRATAGAPSRHEKGGEAGVGWRCGHGARRRHRDRGHLPAPAGDRPDRAAGDPVPLSARLWLRLDGRPATGDTGGLRAGHGRGSKCPRRRTGRAPGGSVSGFAPDRDHRLRPARRVHQHVSGAGRHPRFRITGGCGSVRDRAGVGVYGRPGRGRSSPQQTCPPDSDRGAHRRDRVLPAHRPVRPALRRTESGVGHRLPLHRTGRRPHHHRVSGHLRRVHRPVLVDGGPGQHAPAAGSGDAQGPTIPLADRGGTDHPGDPVFRAQDHGPIRQPDPGHCRHLSADGPGPEHRGRLRRAARSGLRGLLRSWRLHHGDPHLAAVTRVHSRDLGARLPPLRDDGGRRRRHPRRHSGHSNAWRLSGHRHPGFR